MKILLIAQEAPLDTDQIVTGNALRVAQLSDSLLRAGHEIQHVWGPVEGAQRRGATFQTRDSLADLLQRYQPEVVLVSYWEILDLFPFEYPKPVIVDFIAPRPLEDLFENPDLVQHNLHRLKVNLAKADLLLTGNETQKDLLLFTLLETGVDLREEPGVLVVRLAGEIAGTPGSDPDKDGWTLVSGGVNWPWRKPERYRKVLEKFQAEHDTTMRLVRFGGGYPLHDAETETVAASSGDQPLQTYRNYSKWLLEHAHIGIELADENVERRVSQSFRSFEFLRHGLPLICNSYLPIASSVKRHDAGWLVEAPAEIPELLEKIFSEPESWRRKSINAARLVREELQPDNVIAPLIKWLEKPHKAQRFEPREQVEPELAIPPWPQRLKRMIDFRRLLQGGFVFQLQRKIFAGRKADGIVLVSRGDLFPADHGAAVKIVETARGLSKNGRPVALVTDNRRYWWRIDNGTLNRRRMPLWIRLLSWPGLITKMLHYSKDIPQSNAFLYLPLTDGSFFWRTLYAGKQVGASVLQAEFPAYVRPCLPAGRVLEAHVVLVQHNVEYERIKAQVPELTDAQYRRYRAIEIDLCNQCAAVICVSDNDRQQLAQDGAILRRLHTIPHGVDLEGFKQPALDMVREKFGIEADATLLVYHGTYSYWPNLEALQVFADELLPRLDSLGHHCHVLAVGREPPATSPHPRIHLTGSVESIAPWLKAADLAVIPLLEGGGTRMKIIDCFAARLPVISTSKGIEGIPVVDGKQALIIDDWDEMAAAIVRLSKHASAAAKIADSGHALAMGLDWKAIAKTYIELFDSL
jgi:glycosyltransferase involved in cell wall biosynthesis